MKFKFLRNDFRNTALIVCSQALAAVCNPNMATMIGRYRAGIMKGCIQLLNATINNVTSLL